MQKITLLCVGRLREPWAREAAEMYVQRLRPQLSFTVLELPESRGKTPSQQQAEESERILKILERSEGDVWVLDETGKSRTSVQFASAIGTARDAGTPLIFILGGAYGFTDAVRRKAGYLLKLSDMTLPHELCRVLFLEQLYRGVEILKGSGYHHV